MAYTDLNTAMLEAISRLGMYWGKVIANDDPDKLGRIKAVVPNKHRNDTGWAWPVGMPGAGADNQGAYMIPRVGSMVLIGYIQGDYDEPFYFAGNWREDGESKIPTKPMEKDKTDAPNVRVLAQTDNFEVYISDTEPEKRLVLQQLDTDGSLSREEQNTISINLEDGSIRLTASHYLILEAPMISINASGQLSLQGRRVGSLGPKI